MVRPGREIAGLAGPGTPELELAGHRNLATYLVPPGAHRNQEAKPAGLDQHPMLAVQGAVRQTAAGQMREAVPPPVASFQVDPLPVAAHRTLDRRQAAVPSVAVHQTPSVVHQVAPSRVVAHQIPDRRAVGHQTLVPFHLEVP